MLILVFELHSSVITGGGGGGGVKIMRHNKRDKIGISLYRLSVYLSFMVSKNNSLTVVACKPLVSKKCIISDNFKVTRGTLTPYLNTLLIFDIESINLRRKIKRTTGKSHKVN